METNFAELFRISVKDLEKKKTITKKEEKKKEEGKEKKIRYPLPVRVQSGYINYIFTKEEHSGATVDEKIIKTKLRELYPELSSVQFNLKKFSNEFTEQLEKEEEQSILDFAAADGNSDEIAGEGMLKEIKKIEKGCWIKLEIFYQEAKEEQITFPTTIKIDKESLLISQLPLTEIQKVWGNEHPEFANAKFAYDEHNNYLIPYFDQEVEARGVEYNLPIKVGYLDLITEYTTEDFKKGVVTWEDLKKKYCRKHPEYEDSICYYDKGSNTLIPSINLKKDFDGKIATPVLVRGPGFQLVLTKEDLNSKTSVTLEEIRITLEETFPEYSRDRTEMIYDKEKNMVIPILVGSRKGAIIHFDRSNCSLQLREKEGHPYRIETFPFGVFSCELEKKSVEFYLTAKKIPRSLLDEIILFFKKEYPNEAAAQIFYHLEKEQYSIYIPTQVKTPSSVIFERNYELEEKLILVMDVHSHGNFSAYFSSIDDQDEKGTRLFLVLGNLNSDNISSKLRAGIIGYYKYLELPEVFAE